MILRQVFIGTGFLVAGIGALAIAIERIGVAIHWVQVGMASTLWDGASTVGAVLIPAALIIWQRSSIVQLVTRIKSARQQAPPPERQRDDEYEED